MKITDRMTAGADGFTVDWLVGRRIVATYELEDSDRGEFLIHLDNGKTVLFSCDPVTVDDAGVRLPSEKWGEKWEAYLADATDTEAGRAMTQHGPSQKGRNASV